MCALMLDALRRGIIISRPNKLPDARAGDCHDRAIAPMRAGVAGAETAIPMSIIERKKRICQGVATLSRDARIQVLLAVARMAGFESIGAHNGGCFVDITDWDEARTAQLADIIQFASK